MSDAGLDQLAAAVAAPSAPTRMISLGGPVTPQPPHGFWEHVAHVVRVGWRPATGWVCVGILAVNGMVLPLARLKGVPIEALDWHQLTPFVALLLGQGALRTWEKIKGASL